MRLPPALTLLAAPGLLAVAALAQTPSQQAKPVFVTAARADQDPLDVPFATSTVAIDDVLRRSYRTVPQALRDVPGVMIQETAHGHGSPYIRGFTSFRNLFLIDGIRLNNSVFRPGPNQYWNTVDALSLDRLEIVKGPSSVLYGTDAIGGTVQAITRRPYAIPGADLRVEGQTLLRYSSAEDSIQARGEFSIHVPGLSAGGTGILVGATAKSFGDLEGGAGVGDQPGTGYREVAADLKIEHTLDDKQRLTFLHQRMDQRDVPRTHRTTNGITWRGLSSGSDQRRDFDQARTLTYLQYHADDIRGLADSVQASISWHRQQETRDRIRGNGNQEFQGFDVGTLGLLLQLTKDTPVGRLTYGVEMYQDDVDSFLNRGANGSAADAIQGPVADDGTYRLIDGYVQDEFQITDGLEATVGARFNYTSADADSVRSPTNNSQIAIHDSWRSVVGSARLRYEIVPDEVHLFGGASQGFRAPNFSDLSRFDSARSDEFEIPAPNLNPEEYLSYELGLKTQTADLTAEVAVFYVDIEDQILRFPTGTTNAAGDRQVTKANVGNGHIEGIELGVAANVTADLVGFGNATYTYGRVTNFQNNTATPGRTYPTRLMPLTLQVGLRWEPDDVPMFAETVVVHAEKADRLSFDDQRDTTRIPPGGTPGYTVWHIRTGFYVSDSTTFNLLLENVTDVDYRIHGSGLNRPGRNLILGFSSTF